MGQTTPNISIYIPAAGETNYDASFASGMVNIDQHDHSGAPNKGVPITTTGIADGSVTYAKLNPNVVDVTSGLGTHTGGLANQITTTGLLLALAQLGVNGILAKNGTTVNARTITGTANQVAVANGDGVAANPTLSLPSTIYTNISFDSGVNTLSSYTTGTFTPQLAFGGASVGLTTSSSIGKYWKIGSVVYLNIIITLTNKGSSTGVATITGIPGPLTSANDGFFNVFADKSKINTYPAGCTFLSHEINPNSNDIVLGAQGAANRTSLLDTNFANTDEVQLSGFYWVA